MSYPIFCVSVRPLFPYNRRQIFRTLTTKHEDGSLQVRQQWQYPLHQFEIGVKISDKDSFSQISDLWNFYKGIGGAAGFFLWKDLHDFSVQNEIIGYGDGETKTFQLCKTYTYPYNSTETAAIKISKKYIVADTEEIKIGIIAQSRNTDYTIDNDTGIITFASAPINEAIITAVKFEFYYLCRISEDVLDIEYFAHLLATSKLIIEEVR